VKIVGRQEQSGAACQVDCVSNGFVYGAMPVSILDKNLVISAHPDGVQPVLSVQETLFASFRRLADFITG